MAASSPALLTGLLQTVSRSFYLTMRVLPAGIRPQISLAYLLARTTDTIADTQLLPPERRLHALRTLRERIVESSGAPLDFGEFARLQGSEAERMLLERVEESLAVLRQFPDTDRDRIRDVLATITGGQELDLRRFASARQDRIVALATDAELDDYTYRVAGCVGEFWTRTCRAHLFPDVVLDDAFLLTNGVRFGKGLQLVNILRDLPADLRQGRCYLPAERLTAAGVEPAALLDPANEARIRPLYDEYLALAEAHLAAGWQYTNRLPRAIVRLRLACAWPILIGVRTLSRLRHGRVLSPQSRIKVSRPEVRRLILSTVVRYPWRSAWEKLFEEAH